MTQLYDILDQSEYTVKSNLTMDEVDEFFEDREASLYLLQEVNIEKRTDQLIKLAREAESTCWEINKRLAEEAYNSSFNQLADMQEMGTLAKRVVRLRRKSQDLFSKAHNRHYSK